MISKNSSSVFWKQPWFQGDSWILPRKSRWILTFISNNSSGAFWKQPWFQGDSWILPRKSRWILTLISNNSSGAFWKQPWFQGNLWTLPWFQKTVLTHFQNNLNFKATLTFYRFTFGGSSAFHVSQKTILISKQLMNFTVWGSKKARITRKHNEIKFEFEKTSNGLHIIFTKDMQSQHN